MNSASQSDTALTTRLTACYTGVVHDVMRAMAIRDFVLPSTLRPLMSGYRLAGPAFTVRGRLRSDLDAHATLLAWTGLLSKCPNGHVLVIQPEDSTSAHMGELSAETLALRGVRGCIVDGGSRDVARIREIGLPVYCRYFTPTDVVARWAPENFEAPISIGGCVVHTGDFVAADDDGICILPRELAHAITDAAETAMHTENLVRTAILAGADPQQAYLKHGKF